MAMAKDPHIAPLPRSIAGWLAITIAAAALGGCQSAMYSGNPDEFSGSVTPQYGPGTYEPPAKVGRNEVEPRPEATVQEHQYEYRGGRDPVTGRAKTQI